MECGVNIRDCGHDIANADKCLKFLSVTEILNTHVTRGKARYAAVLVRVSDQMPAVTFSLYCQP